MLHIGKNKFPYKFGCFSILLNIRLEYLPHIEAKKNKFSYIQSTVSNQPEKHGKNKFPH